MATNREGRLGESWVAEKLRERGVVLCFCLKVEIEKRRVSQKYFILKT